MDSLLGTFAAISWHEKSTWLVEERELQESSGIAGLISSETDLIFAPVEPATELFAAGKLF
jgi:hypothetical protein